MPYLATVKTVRLGISRDGVDKSEALHIRYIGSQLAAHVSLAATTSDITFEQGATTGAANTTTGDNPQVGATPGIIDMSDSAVDTIAKLCGAINATIDWEAWMVDVPGDEATELSTGNGLFVDNLTDQDCTGAQGYTVLLETSLLTAEEYFAGITFNGPSNTPHPHDANTEHLLLEIRATATYTTGGGTSIAVYACDDVLGTSVLIWGPVLAGATTVEKVINLGGAPITGVDGRRISVKMYSATEALTVTRLVLARESIVKGPALRASHMYARLSI